ncbi:MAG: hypothetical protein RJA07_1777 [Bacteroidota bacterium]|jgi:hypothetical protein
MSSTFQQYIDKIEKALQLSYKNMLKEKIKNDEFLIVSENGKVVKIPAKDIKLPE